MSENATTAESTSGQIIQSFITGKMCCVFTTLLIQQPQSEQDEQSPALWSLYAGPSLKSAIQRLFAT